MPELPDVETFGRYIKKNALSQTISDISINRKKMLKGVSIKDFRDTLKGLSFTGTTRYGKYLFLHTTGKIFVMLHFGMTGGIRYFANNDAGDNRFDQVIFHFENYSSLAYTNRRLIGEVTLTEDIESFLNKRKVGVDALAITQDMFTQALKPHKSMIKAVLMDQSIMAGIGNVYSDEILYQSRVHPQSKASDLSDKTYKTLFQNMSAILRTAIEKNADADKIPDSFLLPHRRQGKQCPSCTGTVKKTYIAGRPTYFCPDCQIISK